VVFFAIVVVVVVVIPVKSAKIALFARNKSS